MSMAFPLWPLIYFLLAPSTWAGPPSTESLTPRLQQTVPACAQTCLEFFVAENFPGAVCGPPPNIDCLCTTASTSGFTVGEGALQCLEASCQIVDESDALSAYNVCLSMPNYIPNTHGTLTATISPTTSTLISSTSLKTSTNAQATISNSIVPSTSFTHTTASSTASVTSAFISVSFPAFTTTSSVVSSSQSAFSPVGGFLPSTISTPVSSASASVVAAPATSPAPTLTKPQVAGVAVAGVGATAIAVSLCFLCYSLRRKKARRRNSASSFGGDKVLGSEETSPDMSAIAARDFVYDHQDRPQPAFENQRSPTRNLRLETPATSSEDGWGQYHRDMAPNEIGVAMGPQPTISVRDEHSPITPASNRTRNSQLLPEKPNYSLFPPPLRGLPRNSIPNQHLKPPMSSTRVPPVPALGSPFARAAPPHPSSVDTSQAHLQGGNKSYEESPDPFVDSNVKQSPSTYTRFQDSRPQPPPRSAARKTPVFRVPSLEQPAGVVRKPVPAYDPPRYQGVDPAVNSVESDSRMILAKDEPKRKASKKRKTTSRPLTHFSSGSETSFESLGDEDIDIPDPRSALSPVKEARSPPTGRISYPAIPPSASESPTRGSKRQDPVPSDSLLRKRLGQDKAKEIAGRLNNRSQQSAHDGLPSAKWKVLTSPGIESSESPNAAKSIISQPPNSTPWRR